MIDASNMPFKIYQKKNDAIVIFYTKVYIYIYIDETKMQLLRIYFYDFFQESNFLELDISEKQYPKPMHTFKQVNISCNNNLSIV